MHSTRPRWRLKRCVRLKREESALLNSTLLHELYFASLGGDGPLRSRVAGQCAGARFRIRRSVAREFIAMAESLVRRNRAGSC